MSIRLPLDPPKQWGMTDDELAAWPLSFRDDALAHRRVLPFETRVIGAAGLK